MAEEAQTPEEEPLAEAAAVEETEPAADAAVDETEPAAGAAAAPADRAAAPPAHQAAEQLTPKQRRQRRRAGKAAKASVRGPMTPQERQAARDAERKRKGVVRRGRRLRERERARTGRGAPGEAEPLPALHGERTGQQKTRQGIVVSDRAAKSITVRIDVARRHPRYGKVVRTSSTLHAHDENGDAHIGDTVVVRESRPLSRTKRWRLVQVLERAK